MASESQTQIEQENKEEAVCDSLKDDVRVVEGIVQSPNARQRQFITQSALFDYCNCFKIKRGQFYEAYDAVGNVVFVLEYTENQ